MNFLHSVFIFNHHCFPSSTFAHNNVHESAPKNEMQKKYMYKKVQSWLRINFNIVIQRTMLLYTFFLPYNNLAYILAVIVVVLHFSFKVAFVLSRARMLVWLLFCYSLRKKGEKLVQFV